MGGETSTPFFQSVLLDPLEQYKSISENDEYWNVLFSHPIERGTESTIRSALQRILKRQPQNVNTLLHVTTLSLMDVVHRLSLKPSKAESERLRTILTLIFYSFVILGMNPACSTFFNSHFDDCGLLSITLLQTVIRMLHLPGATLHQQYQCWSGGRDDIGHEDPLRLCVVELLLVSRVSGCQFLDFPRKTFATSAINTMRFLFRGGKRLVKDVDIRLRLIDVSLLLMISLDISPFEIDGSEHQGKEIFGPVLETINRPLGHVETQMYIVPLATLYLLHAPPEMLERMPLQFLYNMLVTLSAWEGEGVSKAVLLIIAGICWRPEPDKIWNAEAAPLFIPGLEAKLWGAVVVELSLNAAIAIGQIKVSRVFAIIVAMLIPKIRGLPLIVAETIVKNVTIGFDNEAMGWIVKAVHWAVNDHIADVTELGVGILRQVDVLREYLENHPDCVECAQLVDWAAKQKAELPEVSQEALNEALKIPTRRAATVSVPPTPPQIEFNFRDHVKELFIIPACDYLARQKGVRFAHAFVN
jgi:hypothetical protein